VPTSKSRCVADRRREVRNRPASGSRGAFAFDPRRAFRTRLATWEAAPRHKGTGGYRMATLEDAPDLGFQNRRFQDVHFRFKTNVFYEWKTGFWHEIVVVTHGK